MRIFLLLSLFTNFAFADCALYAVKGSSENQKLENLFKKSWDHRMEVRPEWAYDKGIKKAGEEWSPSNIEFFKKEDELQVCLQTALGKIKRSKLSSAHQLNFELFKDRVDRSVESQKFPMRLLRIDHMGGIHTELLETLNSMPKQDVADVNRILKRLEKVPQKFAEEKTLLKLAIQEGVMPPKVILKVVPEQFDNLLKSSANPRDSAFFLAFRDLPALTEADRDSIQKRAEQIVSEQIIPAIKDFKKFLVEEYIPKARKTISLQDLPNGKAWYEDAVRNSTTTNLTAEEIHQIGLREVERITSEMLKIKDKVGFKKDLKAFNEFLLKDSKFYYTDARELMRGYRDIAKQIDSELPKLFKTLPRLPYGVSEIPAYIAPSSPTAYYNSGSQESGRAGTFQANTYDLKARPKWGMEALTLHEAVPGHHLQMALAQEMSNVPEFRKHGFYTAFGEGWGLYAESLGSELGMYKDPYSEYGKLSYEIWRAVRLVVDTGMHAKGWTREQALRYFMEKMPKTQLEAEVEIDRYIAWPGQALAYKIGEIKFQELKNKAKAELNEKFNIREFHDAVLLNGALPLNVLEARTNDWIKAQKKLSVK